MTPPTPPSQHPVYWGNSRRGIKVRAKILDMINSYTTNNGFPPSIREIGKEVGLSSSSTVHSHLKRLRAEGKILHTVGGVRDLRIAPDGYQPPTEADRLLSIIKSLNKDLQPWLMQPERTRNCNQYALLVELAIMEAIENAP